MIIIASKPGQLGNRLIVFANLIAFSLENNIKILNPSFDEYCDSYINLKNNSFGEFPLLKQKGRYLPRGIRYFLFKLINLIARASSRLNFDNKLISVLRINWDEEINL